jgi:hypothetical protein
MTKEAADIHIDKLGMQGKNKNDDTELTKQRRGTATENK